MPCKCPRYAHTKCIARWQLQSAGSRKETHCEFCDAKLPDWKDAYTPQVVVPAPAIMKVAYNGTMYCFEVEAGSAGYLDFIKRVKKTFSIDESMDIGVTFTCDEPDDPLSDKKLLLRGEASYDAAVHCAWLSSVYKATLGQKGNSGKGQSMGIKKVMPWTQRLRALLMEASCSSSAATDVFSSRQANGSEPVTTRRATY